MRSILGSSAAIGGSSNPSRRFTLRGVSRWMACVLALSVISLGGFIALAQTATAPPTNVQATAGWRQITLTWTASTTAGVTGYSVLRATQSGGPYAEVANVTGTSYANGGLTTGTTYYYVLVAHAPAGDSSYSNEISQAPLYEVTPPTLTITSPSSNASLTALTSITGTAADAGTGASGLDRVDVFLYRVWRGITEYWDGASASWQATATPLSGTSTTWTRTTGLPSGTNLPPGQYQIKAQAFDRAGNASALATRTFKMSGDTTAPSVAIVSPANGARIETLSAVNGTIADETGGSGVDRVEVRLWRNWNNITQYWNGTAWSGISTWLPATLSTVTNGVYAWSCSTPLPPEAQMPDGSYVINAQGYDCSQNLGSAITSVIKYGDDLTAPTVSLTTPQANATLAVGSSLTTLAGTCVDPTVTGETRTGMNWVRVSIQKVATAEYWDFSSGQWSSSNASTQLYLTSPDTTTWQVTTGLPGGATNLPAGDYTLRAWGQDISANGSTVVARSLFVVASPQNLVADDGYGQIPLHWDASAHALGYNLYRGTASGGPYSQIAANLSGTSYNNTGVTAGATYYYVVRAAVDGGETGNSNQDSATALVDTKVPTVSITAPASGATIPSLTSITGTSGDTAATGETASGIDHVDVTLFRFWRGVTEYWNGTSSTWQTTAIPLPGSTESGWTRSTGLPSGANLPPGQYQITAQSFDRAGNASAIPLRLFKISGDTTAPTVTITTPPNGARVQSLTTVSGTVQDTGGSGVDYVKLRLMRNWNGVTQYWNGTAWSGTVAYLTSTLGTPTNGVYLWSSSGSWPSGTDFPEGGYTITAYAYDCSGNVSSGQNDVIKLGSDTTAPVLTISVPADNAVLTDTGLTQISGTAGDPTVTGETRTGINYVNVYLMRTRNGATEYWNPTGGVWGGTAYWLVTYSTPADGPWSVTTQLPSGANLPPDTYTVKAWAYDITGNSAFLNRTFQVMTIPTPPLSLAATAAYKKVDLSWQAVSNAASYTLLRSTTDGGPYTQIASGLGGTAYSDTNVTGGTTYFYVVRAVNGAGTSPNSNQASATVLKDTKAPTVSITAPTASATPIAPASFTSITGTSGDTAISGEVASGVEHVEVSLYRTQRSVTEYWNATSGAWQTGAATLPANSETGWTRNTSLPSGTNLPPGTYQIKAQSFDNAANASTVVTRTFKIAGDTTAPSVAITTPANNARIESLDEVLGTIQDEAGGSGVDRVFVRLGRAWNGVTEYWTGTGWGASTYLQATLTGSTNGVYSWRCAGLWPTGANLPDGAYGINALGYDCSGNSRTTVANVLKVGDDETPPTITLDVPVANSILTSTGLTQISGTAADPTVAGETRTGINTVRVYLARIVNGATQYWNPATALWGAGAYFWTVTYATPSDGPYSVASGLPSGANLPPGGYILTSIAYDITGNSASVARTLTVIGAPTALTAIAGEEQVQLSWSAGQSASNYRIYRSTDADQLGAALPVTVTDTTYADTTVQPNIVYYYRVCAIADNGETEKSNQANAKVVFPSVDLLIADTSSGQDEYEGDNRHDSNQYVERLGTLGESLVYPVQVQNDGTVPLSVVVTGSSVFQGWTAEYYSARTGGTNITSAVTGDGWLIPQLAAGENVVLRVVLTPGPSAELWDEVVATIRATSLTATTNSDEVNAVTYRVPAVDAKVLAYNPDVPSSYQGWGIINETGIGQVASQTVSPNHKATYHVALENSSATPRTFKVSTGAPNAGAGWTTHYFSSLTGGVEITNQVLNGGWITPEVAAQGWLTLLVEVTPDATIAASAQMLQLLRVADVGGTEVDAIQMKASVLPEKVDGLIGSQATDLSQFLGDGIYQSDGQGQTLRQFARPTQATNFYAEFQNEGGSRDAFTVQAVNTGDPRWQIRYFLNTPSNQEITEQVTGAGWVSPVVPAAGSLKLRIEVVIANLTLPVNDVLEVLLTATTPAGATDAVKAEAVRVPWVDALIRQHDTEKYIGDMIYSATGVNENVSQSLSNRSDGKLIFDVQVRNDASSNSALQLKAPSSGGGWTAAYFDSLKDGANITSDIAAENGWTTPSLAPGETFEIRVEVSLTATASPTATATLAVHAQISGDASTLDTVTATVGLQSIASIQYSLDQGGTWLDKPGDGAPVSAFEGESFGVRALKSNPSLPWPLLPQLQPEWNNEGSITRGEEVWLFYGNVVALTGDPHQVTATCGNAQSLSMLVFPKYSVAVKSSKAKLLLAGGGDASQATLTATVKRRNGSAASGMRLRFSLEPGSPACGINQTGTADDVVTTSATGTAQVTLSAGTAPGTARIEAVLLSETDTPLPWKRSVVVEVAAPDTEPEPPAPPPAPTAVTLSVGEPVTVHEVPLGWTENTDIGFQHYELHRSTTQGFTPSETTLVELITGQDETQFLDDGLSPNTTYYYRLAVVNEIGQKALSNEVPATTTALPVFTLVPEQVTLSFDDCKPLTYNKVPLKWQGNAIEGFDRYEVHRSTEAGFTPSSETEQATFFEAENLRAVDVEVTPGTTYYYKVLMFNQAEQSATSNQLTVTVPAAPPPAP